MAYLYYYCTIFLKIKIGTVIVWNMVDSYCLKMDKYTSLKSILKGIFIKLDSYCKIGCITEIKHWIELVEIVYCSK